MNRTTLIVILVVLAIIAVGIWAWTLRPRQYPKKYEGEAPAGPNAPQVMDRPMGVERQPGGQGTAPEQPKAGVQPF